MSGRITGLPKAFRQTFSWPKKDVVNWFPGHMAKGMKQMQKHLKNVDCIIEVHDARIPFSGRNPNFYHLLSAARPRLLVLNKMDLANLRYRNEIEILLRQKMGDEHVIFANCTDQSNAGVKQIIPLSAALIKSNERFNRSEVFQYKVMVIGIPNVGKSSLINALRNQQLKKGNATRVGALPGITRSVLEKIKICDDPTIYLLDTPGILQPHITDVEVGMKLALCATVKSDVIDIITVADYLLYWMNSHENFSYVGTLNLKEPTDDIYEVLIHTAQKLNKMKMIRSFEGPRMRHPDIEGTAHYFVKTFQVGKLGKIMFDIDLINKNMKIAEKDVNFDNHTMASTEK